MSFINLDFTNIETSRRMSAGTHQVTISSSEIKTASSGNQMLAVTYRDADGAVAYDNFVLLPQSMWKLKMFLEAVFQAPFNSKVQFDPKNIVNRRLVIKVEDEDYVSPSTGEPSVRARVTSDYQPVPLDSMIGIAPSIPQTPTAAPNPAPVPPVGTIQQSAPGGITTPVPPVIPKAAVQPTVVQPAPVYPGQEPVQPAAPVESAPIPPVPQSTPVVETPVAPTPTATSRPKLPWEK